MFGLKLHNYEHPLEVTGCSSETQLQVGARKKINIGG